MQKSSAPGAGHAAQAEPERRPRRSVEIGAALTLAVGGLAGLALWAKWGFLVAFDAVITYCFG